ncbi:hypothetical protein ORIO_06270 [Cereibacter azotoformans]|uniref:Uncharacterized protein n=2 Tax=Cereibacter TaxID=1653176 RepID=A0A2T5JTM6_9RHOB|nr:MULTISPECIES: hypothetical protein [Cereibacter]AXQ93412.1 hypothetical protein D0Z66_06070 [Cereibacter sphaeroides]MBO4168832.1 hypothetical protein [Cereibacter azotoformans]PTR13522.1 hypothetical protein C8J28_12110 [Cereibacter azotoformans]UIJ31743.1 hypothetical protein LV780_06055 [Cereibacter azotoformans]ULB09531.1 hypothetical protein ORIO_06270 [Cereibacter azotoformans]
MEQEDIRTRFVLAWVNSQDKLEFDRHYPDGSPLEFDSEEEAIAAIPHEATRLILKSVTRHRAD